MVGETVTVNGLLYTAASSPANESQFAPFTFADAATNNSRTADNLATVILNDTRTGTFGDVRTVSDGVDTVKIRQKSVGTSGNTALTSSNGASLIVSGATMTGGTGTGEFKVTF